MIQPVRFSIRSKQSHMGPSRAGIKDTTEEYLVSKVKYVITVGSVQAELAF